MATQAQQDPSARSSEPTSTTRNLTRRAVLGAGLGGAAALGLARGAPAQAGPGLGFPNVPRTRYLDSLLRFLVDRTSFGWHQREWNEAKALGYQAYLERQLDPASIDDSASESWIATNYPTLSMTSKQLYDTYGVTGQYQVPMTQLKTATLLRAAYSRRQLHEKMVEFWSDHFNMDHADGEIRLLKTADDRDVIRPFALTTFASLLDASAHSGAMLVYLDNYSNKNTAPNENYARELMELHTVGVGNFSETDVVEAARCLTGWTRFAQNHALYGDFQYNSSWHDNGAKTVLGVNIPANGGQADGDLLLGILLNRVETAQYIAWKLCRRFLSYAPPQSIVDAVAAVYQATGGDIKSMLRKLFDPATVQQLDATSYPKLRRPFDLVCAVLRTTEPQLASPQNLITELGNMGHLPFGWSPPDGYPETPEAWGSTIRPRWNFLARYFDGSISGVVFSTDKMLAGVPQSQLATAIGTRISGGALAPEDIAGVQAFVNSYGTVTTTVKREAFALAASSPSFQYH